MEDVWKQSISFYFDESFSVLGSSLNVPDNVECMLLKESAKW